MKRQGFHVPSPIQVRSTVAKQNHQILHKGVRKMPLSSLSLEGNLSPQARISGMMQQIYTGKP